MNDWLPLIQKMAVFVFLVSSMMATGLSLAPAEIMGPLRDLRCVLLSLVLNFVFAPAFAWLLTVVIPLESGHAAGLLLLSGAAGAPFLPKLVDTARGDPALAAGLMVLLTAATILFLPFAVPLMVPGLPADPWSIARPLVLLIVVPLAAGMLVKSRLAGFAWRAAPVLARIGNASLLLLFVLLITVNIRSLLGVLGSGAIAAAAIYVFGLFATGWLLGGSEPRKRGVLGLATAARNFGAALVPAASSQDSHVTIMLIVCAIVCLVICFLAAGWLRRMMISAPR